MIALEDAQRTVLSQCPPLRPVSVALADAVGRVLAADAVADEDVPPFDNSAVDGYAVLSSDIASAPAELRVVDEVAAGAASSVRLEAGQAIRIMTGAPMPDGADAVVMIEHSEILGDEAVRLDPPGAPLAAGTAVRSAGSDVRVGDIVAPAGTVVTPAVVGTLASVNARRLDLYPAVRVAVMSTGDELVSDGGELGPGQIRESNLLMLEALLIDTGCQVMNFGVIRDDETAVEAALDDAVDGNDAIITSGGVSMGEYDVVKAVLGRIAEMDWMQIAIRPAKPFAFGRLGGVPIFGLPGNPVSALVSFELMARPCLRRMMGFSKLARTSVVAITDEAIVRRPDGKVHFDRVYGTFADDGRYHVRSV
ncbi:MAG: molybdopterin molybdotransferase MoeA, partial [Actinomycetota bacterium]|nr:molybdopterin molybdotransferase MoeA [Actinomycetota bacterium]